MSVLVDPAIIWSRDLNDVDREIQFRPDEFAPVKVPTLKVSKFSLEREFDR